LTYTDIYWDNKRFKDADYFTIVNEKEIHFNYTGVYNVFIKITAITSVVGTFGTCRYKVQKSVNGGAYADVASANCYTTHDIVVLSSSSSGSIIYIESATAGDSIKVSGIINTGRTSNTGINVVTGQCEIIVSRLQVNETFDTSTYIDSYINTTKSVTTTLADTVFDVNRYSDTITHTAGTAIFTIPDTGTYLIMVKLNVSGTAKAYTTSQLMTNTTGTYVVVPGSLCYGYINDATNNDGSSFICVIDDFVAGNSIKLQSSSSVGTMSIIDGSSIYIACLKSSSNNQTDVKHICAYNTTAVTMTTLNVYVDISLQGTNTTNAIYTLATPSITLNETGKYLIIYRTSANNAVTNVVREDICQSRLVMDSGSGFVDVPGSMCSAFTGAATNYRATSVSFNILYVKSGSIIKMQCMKTLSTSTMTTVPNGSSFCIIKLDKAPVTSTLPGVILNYGTYFQYVINFASSSTTGTTYIPKLVLNTVQIPDGIYRIDMSYQVAPIANLKDLKVRCIVDSFNVVHETVISYTSTATSVYSDFAFVQLTNGFHEISLDYATSAGGSSGIYNCKLSIVRVL
jgi:hypothetical protein